MNTYPEMNAKIVSLLRIDDKNPVDLYAAQRIEELELELEQMRKETELSWGMVPTTCTVKECWNHIRVFPDKIGCSSDAKGRTGAVGCPGFKARKGETG